MGEESSCDAWLNRRESADELHRLAVAELVRRYNELAGQLNRPGSSRITATSVRQEYMSRIEAYSTELARHESVCQGQRMEALTNSINVLTWVITGATIVGVVLTAVGLLFGG